jgi:glutamyl-tRNA synthetase
LQQQQDEQNNSQQQEIFSTLKNGFPQDIPLKNQNKRGRSTTSQRNLITGQQQQNDEIISDADAIKWFDLNGIGASPARLDIEKLNSVNHHYMKQAAPERLAALLRGQQTAPAMSSRSDASCESQQAFTEAILKTALPWLVERASTLLELGEQAAFMTAARPLTLTEKAATLVATAEAKTVLGGVASVLGNVTEWSEAALKTACEEYMTNNQLKPKQFMPVLRAALSGKEASAGSIYQIMHALGRDETLGRIKDLC